MPDMTKFNPFLEDDENKKFNALPLDAAVFEKKTVVVKEEDEDDGGEGGSGRITVDVEQREAYLQACFTKERRQGQKKFGPVPFTEDPNSLLGRKRRRGGSCGELPHAHPLLRHSQQFSGDDPEMTAIPLDNPKARERYPELRLENQFRKTQSLSRSKSKSVTLTR
jgi:hypothetical protein